MYHDTGVNPSTGDHPVLTSRYLLQSKSCQILSAAPALYSLCIKPVTLNRGCAHTNQPITKQFTVPPSPHPLATAQEAVTGTLSGQTTTLSPS